MAGCATRDWSLVLDTFKCIAACVFFFTTGVGYKNKVGYERGAIDTGTVEQAQIKWHLLDSPSFPPIQKRDSCHILSARRGPLAMRQTRFSGSTSQAEDDESAPAAYCSAGEYSCRLRLNTCLPHCPCPFFTHAVEVAVFACARFAAGAPSSPPSSAGGPLLCIRRRSLFPFPSTGSRGHGMWRLRPHERLKGFEPERLLWWHSRGSHHTGVSPRLRHAVGVSTSRPRGARGTRSVVNGKVAAAHPSLHLRRAHAHL